MRETENDPFKNRSSLIVNSIESWIKKGLNLNNWKIGLKTTPYYQYMSDNSYFQNYSQTSKNPNRKISNRFGKSFITEWFQEKKIWDSSSTPQNISGVKELDVGNNKNKAHKQSIDDSKLKNLIKHISEVCINI